MTERLDAAGATDLTPELRIITGRRVTAERVARRLQTVRGSLWYDDDAGTSLIALLNAGVPAQSVAAMTEIEALKDEEVLDASAVVERIGGTLSVSLTLTDADGPFTLRLTVDQLTVQLLQGAA